MATGKRYYWIKLRDSFLTSDTIDFFMSQPEGANYVVLYQMLCLKTINTEGKLERTIGEVVIPYDVEKLQRDCKWFSADTIRVALGLYKKFGLIYEDQNGTLVLANHSEMVGSETDYASQKSNQRQKKLEGGHSVDKGVDNVHTDIRDKDTRYKDTRYQILDTRDKSSEKEIYPPTQPSVVCPPKGETRKFVKPNLDEVRDLCEERGYTLDPQSFLDYYDSNGWRVGKNPMKDWKAALANWQRNEKEYSHAVQPKPMARGDMNYQQHEYKASDFDDRNSDLERLYGGD